MAKLMIEAADEIKIVYQTAMPKPQVSLELFRSRIKSCMNRFGKVESTRVNDALYLNAKEYRVKYGTRRTYIDVEGIGINLNDYFAKIIAPSIRYSTFRQRVKRLKKDHLLDINTLEDAAKLSSSEWTSFFGGGRRREFEYQGSEFPEYYGEKFRGISVFLRKIGRYNDRAIIWSRMKNGWEIDEAITSPVLPLDERLGTIYLIACDLSSKKYVGLTRTSIKQRWRQHLQDALKTETDTLIAKAIRQYGPDHFTIVAIEEGINQVQLAERERYWIAKLETREPNGFNIKPGGEMSSGCGKEVDYNGEIFPSIEAGATILAKRTGFPKHVIHRCLSQGRPIPDCPREMSDHPEAGTNLWRRWKSLINGIKTGRRKGKVCPEWHDYDNFAMDVRDGHKSELKLVRIDESKPWCGGNVRWITQQEVIEKVHGTRLTIDGKVYPSYNAVARAYKINRTTLRYRLEVQGLSIEEAVRKPLGPTSKSHKINDP